MRPHLDDIDVRAAAAFDESRAHALAPLLRAADELFDVVCDVADPGPVSDALNAVLAAVAAIIAPPLVKAVASGRLSDPLPNIRHEAVARETFPSDVVLELLGV